ncbi:MAG: nucleoside deaminase [Nitrospirae bacterium]|nr:nucleoside deaminase [Nitrospirota bacterium]
MTLHEDFMRSAIEEARAAAAKAEVPIGAVIVKNDQVVVRAHNLRESAQDPTAHAELLAIKEAAAKEGSWRLTDATMYVTLEPCIMCVGAILLARIPRLVFGARDEKAGAAGSLYDIPKDKRLSHRMTVVGGILERECADLLTTFFKELRKASTPT